jgi:hypothetical protein
MLGEFVGNIITISSLKHVLSFSINGNFIKFNFGFFWNPI